VDPAASVDLVRQAGQESGWMAAALCLVGAVAISGLIVMVRRLMVDQAETERFIRSEMSNVIDDNTLAFGKLGSILRKRPCLSDSDVDAITDGKDDSDLNLSETGKRVLARRAERVKQRQKEAGT
jgi:hypothetical protein